ncbi:aspartate:alanine exchanger family transporter [Virgisporangium ochraceum]|uniref:Putative transporter n=1 Tax=Virgisporangium ochraceum TaxID=65505 RepID=A0A8J4A7B8_9ACTN|nr:TrkA C-terminal domain-containing protein [Virgisporangium ochraceum]GIJ75503.1 putative transporter [Virgisporangium ochraceum]
MIVDFLAGNPLLTLFVVVGGGFLAGRVRLGGFGLGVAGVLFTGIALGALDARLALPDIVYLLGLGLFVYTMGLSAGPGFVRSLRRTGLRWNAFATAAIAAVAAVVAALSWLLDLGPAKGAGFFTGVLTNTPALAGVVERLSGGPDANLPVVAYSMAYPVSVLACLVSIGVLQRVWRVDHAAEARAAGLADHPIHTATARVRRPVSVTEVVRATGGRAVVGRVAHAGALTVAEPGLLLQPGDRVTIVGERDAIADATSMVGETAADRLDTDRSRLDVRRVFVSDPDLVGRRLEDLGLARRFGATVTRVRRGDADSVADLDTVLELGDRVRVLAPPARMREVSRFFGDSYKDLGEVDIASLSLGLALGLLLGAVSLPLPGGGGLSLGFAGGPLVAGLVLGARRRTGPLVWQLPSNVNWSLRQMGLVLFLAGIGTRAGPSFVRTAATADGVMLVVAAFAVCVLASAGLLWLGHRVLRWPMGVATGVLAAVHTQPATLGYAVEQSDNELPERAYAAVYPTAMILKILLAQLLLTIL